VASRVPSSRLYFASRLSTNPSGDLLSPPRIGRKLVYEMDEGTTLAYISAFSIPI